MVAADLVQLCRKAGVEVAPETEIPVTVSLGVADFSDRPDAETVMRRADAAMYGAKAAGRDRWVAAWSPTP